MPTAFLQRFTKAVSCFDICQICLMASHRLKLRLSISLKKISKRQIFVNRMNHLMCTKGRCCCVCSARVWFLIQSVSRLFSRCSQSEAQRTAAQCSETSGSTGTSLQNPHRTRQDQYVITLLSFITYTVLIHFFVEKEERD